MPPFMPPGGAGGPGGLGGAFLEGGMGGAFFDGIPWVGTGGVFVRGTFLVLTRRRLGGAFLREGEEEEEEELLPNPDTFTA